MPATPSLAEIIEQGVGESPDNPNAEPETDESAAAETEASQESEESASPPEEAAEEPEEETDADEEPTQEFSGEEALQQFVDVIRSHGGPDLTGKYKTLQDALAGVAQATALVGRRDEGAARFEELRKRLGDEGIQALMQAQPKGQDGLPTVEKFQQLRARADKGDQQAAQQVEEINEQFLRRAYEMAQMLPQIQQVVRLAQEGSLLTRGEHAQEIARERTEQWIQLHRDDLYVDGKYDPANPSANLSSVGKEVARLMQHGLADADMALNTAKRSLPKPAGTRKPARRARRAAPVAGPSTTQKTMDDLAKECLARDGDLGSFLALCAELNAGENK